MSASFPMLLTSLAPISVPGDSQAGFAQRLDKRIFIDSFQESSAGRVENGEGSADDFAR